MTKSLPPLPAEWDALVELMRLEAIPSARERVLVSALLDEARALVDDEAQAKSLSIIVVGVNDYVVVKRVQVVLVIAALLRDAIRNVHARGRVAVTAQEIERDLAVAVFDSGKPRVWSTHFADFAAEAARALGGRVWTSRPMDGNLSLFSVPLVRDDN